MSENETRVEDVSTCADLGLDFFFLFPKVLGLITDLGDRENLSLCHVYTLSLSKSNLSRLYFCCLDCINVHI
ncbi:hypothetical protein XELAEV_18002965mg [Xenopus laevis]|nr:hypothetical protein XELAEV_18002965mg [Xenopus laevis]